LYKSFHYDKIKLDSIVATSYTVFFLSENLIRLFICSEPMLWTETEGINSVKLPFFAYALKVFYCLWCFI